MGADYFNMYQLIQNIIDRILGIPDFQRAGSKTRKTATQASFEQGDVSIRREYFLGFVKKHVLSQVRKLDGLMKQYYDRKKYIRIESDAGVDYVEYSKEDIQGDYQFDFDVDSFKYMNQVDTQQILTALQTISQIPVLQPIMQQIDPIKAGTEVFKRIGVHFDSIMKGEKERVRFIDPATENKLALAGEMLEAKVQEDHDWHIEEHTKGPDGLETNPASEEIRRHIQDHLQKSQNRQPAGMGGTPAKPEGPPLPQQEGQQISGMEGGTQGPMNPLGGM